MGIALYWIEVKPDTLTKIIDNPTLADNAIIDFIAAAEERPNFIPAKVSDKALPVYDIISHFWIDYNAAINLADIENPEFGDLVHKYVYGDIDIRNSQEGLKAFSENHFIEAVDAFSKVEKYFYKHLKQIQNRKNKLLSMDA